MSDEAVRGALWLMRPFYRITEGTYNTRGDVGRAVHKVENDTDALLFVVLASQYIAWCKHSRAVYERIALACILDDEAAQHFCAQNIGVEDIV